MSEARDLPVALPGHGSVVLTIPEGWVERVERAKPELPPTINLFPEKGGGFHILITPMWPASGSTPKMTRDTVRDVVRKSADGALGQSVERELPIVEFATPTSFGSYFAATDRAPEPDGFKHLTQGMMALSDLGITFTILVNGEPGPVVEQALQVLKSMRREPGSSAGAMLGVTERRFALPSSTVGLVIPGEDWVVDLEIHRPGETAAYYMLSSEKVGMPFSFYIDRTTVCRSSEECLNAALKNPAYGMPQDLQTSEVGPFAVATFFVDPPPDLKVFQAHVLASAYVDGQWFDIHISSLKAVRPDMKALLGLLRQVAIR